MSESYDVIVIGGGPGGSTVGTMLARAGHRVLILERSRFPRFHIGESISVYGMEHFRRLGVMEELKSLPFIKKRGIEFALPSGPRKSYFPIEESEDPGKRPWTFQMTRQRLDEILLKNARRNGAEVLEGQKVLQVLFDRDRAIGVEFRESRESNSPVRTALGRWIIDASGQAAILNRQMGGNCYNDVLLQDKIAVFCHMKGDLGFENENDDELNFKLCIHENGKDWAWFIPVEQDLVSLGIVLSRDSVKERKNKNLSEMFFESAEGIPALREFLEEPTLEQVGKFRGVNDYSYRSRQYFGPGWVLVGDCAGFIDPLFSTGIQITFNSAFKLADLLDGVLKSEREDLSSLREYEKTLDRYYRVGSTLTYLFYLSGMNPANFEDAKYIWTHIDWAGWRYKARFLWRVLKLWTVPSKRVKHWGEEVLFGNASPDNLIADMFFLLSQNYDEVNEERVRRAGDRQKFVELET